MNSTSIYRVCRDNVMLCFVVIVVAILILILKWYSEGTLLSS